MATWLIIAALTTIGVTALLTGVLYRLNGPPQRAKESGDGAVMTSDSGPSDRPDAADTDGGAADGGGADGGGGD